MSVAEYFNREKQREAERRRRLERARRRFRQHFGQEQISGCNERIKMVLTTWSYDELGNWSRVLYREE